MRYACLLLSGLALSASAAEMRSVDIETVDGRYVMRSEVWFAATKESVYTVFVDYDLSTQFSSAIAEARNIPAGPDGRPGFYVRNRGCVLFFCKSFERYGFLDAEPYTVIRASIDPETSDFYLSNESWQFRTERDGTLVTYDLEFKPKFWVPPVIGPYLIKEKLRDDGGTAIDRIEALAQGLMP